MLKDSEKTIILTTQVRISPKAKLAFVDWQAKLNAIVSTFPGFISLEILSSPEPNSYKWVIVQRFDKMKNMVAWRESKECQTLIEELKELLRDNGSEAFQEVQSEVSNLQGGVTEIFVTKISPNKEEAYRKWVAKIHQVEAQFPGFRGVYVQAPAHNKGEDWITLLQFDTIGNLDRWLLSPERQEVLQESKSLIAAIESHRVISPYAGWFASLSTDREVPPVWKQTMIVLLVLFPIVMLEMKYLSPLTAKLNPSLATFIGNAISVSLISWPMVPIAIKFLGWWLSPPNHKRRQATLIGTLIVILLYVLEIIIFWNLLP